MKKNLLPIGSVVLLSGGTKRVMILGRIQTDIAAGKTYDYSACLYPEGIINSNELVMFNHENIETVFFIGYQDREEFEFKKRLAESLETEEKEPVSDEK